MYLDSAPLTLALAMAAGIVAQIVARHTRLPGIVVLLGAGVALGPDGADVIRPGLMGSALRELVGFAIAIILFEGGLSLKVHELRAQARVIRRLVTTGALVTGVLATVCAHALMPWGWEISVLFGSLVIVSGPTVVTPLVRRLRLTPRVSSILLAEAVFVDALGATLSVVALEIVLAPSNGQAVASALSIVGRVGTGIAIGGAVGLLLVALLRRPRIVPHGLENMLVLAAAVSSYELSEGLFESSGITAAIVAGMVVGNLGIRKLRALAQFKEELTELLVATLWVLLCADVRLADVAKLGAGGLAVVGLLMFAVRPAAVGASAYGTDLSRRERAYLSWLAPRGIVAAAVGSLFASQLARAGIREGVELRALVFLVIAATVIIEGMSAGPVARLLGVRQPTRSGYLIVGANSLALFVGRILADLHLAVSFVDSNERLAREARQAGFAVAVGDAFQIDTLLAAGIDVSAHFVALTPNENINFLLCRLVEDELPGPELAIGLEAQDRGVSVGMADAHEVGVLFGREHDLWAWLRHARRGELECQRWRLAADEQPADVPGELILPCATVRHGKPELLVSRATLHAGDELVIAVCADHREQAIAWANARGWTRVAWALGQPTASSSGAA